MTATAEAAVQQQDINVENTFPGRAWPERAWQQLVARDRDAGFFYGVTTTGVFCRVGCASRRPRPENVRFFASVAEAARAGFRPCARCKPTTELGKSLDALRLYLEANGERTVSLAELGRVAGLSPFTVQRRFKQAFGASPLQYQRALRAQRFRATLKEGGTVTHAMYDAGFNSASRAYEGASLGMAPARFAAGGRGERIGYATGRSPFGWMVIGATARGLCWLALADSEAAAAETLREEFPAAEIDRDAELCRTLEEALARTREGSDLSEMLTSKYALDLRGTVFQLRVWEALRRIPRGETRSYSEFAAQLGNANATRAVARACATNRVAILVPCHRVVGLSGSATGYRWGIERKKKLLEGERQGPGNRE